MFCVPPVTAAVPPTRPPHPTPNMASLVRSLLARSPPAAGAPIRGLASAPPKVAHTVVLMRHGMSAWNVENRFTGWVDVPLTAAGEKEARRGGALLKAAGFQFDAAHTSVLKRAIKTCWLALEEMDQMWVPVTPDWRLNERHYGELSGLDKAETTAKHGAAKVTEWRRSYDVPPPPMAVGNVFDPSTDRRYAGLPAGALPRSESTSTTADRVLPYWDAVLAPAIKSGKRLLIVAHGNSLRALVKRIDNISPSVLTELNSASGGVGGGAPACAMRPHSFDSPPLSSAPSPHRCPPRR